MILKCQHCGAELILEESLRTTLCVFCDSPSVIERPEEEAGPRPAFVLGFVQPEEDVRRRVGKWLKSRNIFCPSGVRNADVEEIQGVYVPAYLYSAVSRTEYSARIGENYQEVETYTRRNSKGELVTETRVVTKTEWRSLVGTRVANIADVLVTASKGLENRELLGIRPFDWRALKRFSPAMVAGWPAEIASIDVDTCFSMARAESAERARRALSSFMPGDSHQILDSRTELREEAADHVLVPCWLLNARYAPNKPPFRIVVNGQTGAVHGSPPLSPWRILFAVSLVVAFIVLLFVTLGDSGGL